MTPISPSRSEPLANAPCIRRNDPLIVPPQSSDRRIALRVSDWHRIKARLSGLARPVPDFAGVYYVLFGFSGSALLAALPIAVARGLPAWVLPLFLCLFLYSSLSAFLLVRANKHVRTAHQSTIAEILADIKEIDRTFKPDTLVSGVATRVQPPEHRVRSHG